MVSPNKKARKRDSNVVAAEAAPQPQNEVEEVEMEDDIVDAAQLYEDEEGGYKVGEIYIPPPIKPYCSNESKGSRLIITGITVNNFKSYAGEVTLGPFCHRFNAIIGPNGSGKSNVIDSMLFVFGYRANKVRCKKLSLLIHNSKSHPNVDSCRVAVHFALVEDLDDGSYVTVPNSEFIVARGAYRNNSSYYTIDEQRVHFKEVAKLLKKHNVDLDHNRFLILQGEVESIAMMKPKALGENDVGHLEYLEDIIGTTRYKEPLQKIAARVDVLTDERTEKHNRCKIAERDINDLKQPMEEAVSFLKEENELTRLRNKQFQKYLYDIGQKLEKNETELEEKNQVMKEHDEKYKEISRQRMEKEGKIKEELAEREKLLKKKEEFEHMRKNALAKHDEIHSTMTETNKRRKQIAGQLKKKQEELEELKKVPEKNEKEIKECETKIEKLTKDKKKAEAQLQENLLNLKDQIDPLTAEKEKYEQELTDVQVRNDNAKSELQIAETELKLTQQNEMTEKRKFETFKTSLEETKNDLEERRNKLQEYEQEIPEIKREIVDTEETLRQNKKKEGELTVEVTNLRSIVEEKTTTMNQARHNSKIVEYLMRKKLSGEIPGILGRLGDLGGIDKKYDVAISTCCGRLDNILVDTVSTAQACIDALKRDNAGRATFIALEKVAHYADQMHPIQTPENVPRLFDLVRVEDERLRPAFYFSLFDTLVANDLAQATRIAFGATRFRTVSLNGDVIETSGTMSGGGRTQFRGKMGEKVKTKTNPRDSLGGQSGEDLKQMQIKIRTLQDEINHLQHEHGVKERRLAELRGQLRAKEVALKKFCTDMETFARQIPALEDQLKRQKKIMDETRSDPKKVAELEKLIESRTKIFDKCSAETKKITDKIDIVSAKIKEINEKNISSIEKNIRSLTTQSDKLNKNILKLKVDITTSERNVKKCEESIESMKEEIESAQSDLVRMDKERDEAADDAKELEKRLKELEKQLAEFQSDSAGIKKEIIALQKQESDGKLERVEIEQQIQNVLKVITELKDSIPYYKNKLKPLKLHKIPNEDEPEPLKVYMDEELSTAQSKDLQYKVTCLEENIKSKTPNLNVIDEYQKKMDVLVERIKILEEITNKRNEMRKLFDEVKKRRYTEFMAGFGIITRKLKEMYQMITQGGNAELELVDSMDPFSEGITFSVRPPRKSWKNISNLSGGEKTLSSLALVFALHYYKPSPLYFMDEIDAALDFKNVSIVANYIKDRTKNAQFIIISLRSNMFELADYLTGIYKVDDCTDSLTIPNVPPKPPGQRPSSQQSAVNPADQAATTDDNRDFSMLANEGPLSPPLINPEAPSSPPVANDEASPLSMEV